MFYLEIWLGAFLELNVILQIHYSITFSKSKPLSQVCERSAFFFVKPQGAHETKNYQEGIGIKPTGFYAEKILGNFFTSAKTKLQKRQQTLTF